MAYIISCIFDSRAYRLMAKSEIEREAILAQRQEEMQRFTDKRQLDLMVKMQSGRGDESVSKAAKRAFPFIMSMYRCSPCFRPTRSSWRDQGEEQEIGRA